MLHEVAAELSPAHFITATIFTAFGLCIRYALKKGTDEVTHLYRHSRKQAIKTHVEEEHGGHPLHCTDTACASVFQLSEVIALELI